MKKIFLLIDLLYHTMISSNSMFHSHLKKILTIIIVILYANYSLAQDSANTKKKHVLYNAMLQPLLQQLNSNSMKGHLASTDTSSINFLKTNNSIQKIPVVNVDYLSFRRKNSIGRGAWIGALAGFGVGAIAGLASGSDKKQPYINDGTLGGAINDAFTVVGNAFAMTAGEKALTYGLTGGIGGSVAGIVIGAVAKKKFIIKGSAERYRAQKAELLKYMQ